MSTKTLYTYCWGNYWQIFGNRFIECVNKLRVKPDQIFVVSDKKLNNCPFEVILVNQKYLKKYQYTINAYKQTAIDNTKCDWYCPIDLDDEMYPNYISNIDDNFDVIFCSSKGYKAEKFEKTYENFFNLNHNENPHLCTSWSFVKSKHLKKFKFSNYGFEDRYQFTVLRYMNLKIKFDNTIRLHYEKPWIAKKDRNVNPVSQQNKQKRLNETYRFYKKIRYLYHKK